MDAVDHRPLPGLGSALRPVVRRLVEDAMARGEDAQLPTNAHYLREHRIGAGTIQRALKTLEEHSALHTTSHGHRGRTIAAIDIRHAWHIAGLAPVRLLLPPSGPAEIDTLEDTLAEELTRLGIPHTVRHQRGGGLRLTAVDKGAADIAVTSGGVVGQHKDRCAAASLDLSRTLPQGSYYGPNRVLTVRRLHDDTPARRVAIDHQSPDHSSLTLAEFPESAGFSYVETPFTNVPAAVLGNEVDAGIWHLQDSVLAVIPLDLAGLRTEPLVNPETKQAWRRLSPAVLTAWNGRPELAAVLTALRLGKRRRMS